MNKFTTLACVALLLGSMQHLNAQAPTTAAPIPTYSEYDVICFYNGSRKYPQATELSALPWGQTASYDFAETADGEECMIVNDLGWMPIGLARRQQGVLDMVYMHVDVYCNQATYFQIGFQGYGDGGSETYFPGFNYDTPGQWYSIDYPLSLMTEQGFNLGLTNVLRIGGGSHEYSPEIYIDNMFAFIGTPTNPYDPTGINETQNAQLTIYPSVVVSSFNVNANAEVAAINVYDITGKTVASFTNASKDLNISKLASGTYIVSAELVDGTVACKKIIKK